jgi:AraC-like DNA-binding protein
MSGKKLYLVKTAFAFSKRNIAEYKRIFNAPVTFDEERNFLVYKVDDMSTPLTSYNKSLYSFFNLLLTEKQNALAVHNTHAEEVKEVLLRKFGGQAPPVEVVASSMNMSTRTFQRRLAEENITFRQIINKLKKELAFSLMENPHTKLRDIAELMGYSDLNSFRRAFKSWTG